MEKTAKEIIAEAMMKEAAVKMPTKRDHILSMGGGALLGGAAGALYGGVIGAAGVQGDKRMIALKQSTPIRERYHNPEYKQKMKDIQKKRIRAGAIAGGLGGAAMGTGFGHLSHIGKVNDARYEQNWEDIHNAWKNYRSSGSGNAGRASTGNFHTAKSTFDDLAGVKFDSFKTKGEVAKAYRRAATKYHPDVNPHGEEMMKKLNNAWDAIKNSDAFSKLAFWLQQKEMEKQASMEKTAKDLMIELLTKEAAEAKVFDSKTPLSLKKKVTIGAGVAGAAGLAYGGKKLYDHVQKKQEEKTAKELITEALGKEAKEKVPDDVKDLAGTHTTIANGLKTTWSDRLSGVKENFQGGSKVNTSISPRINRDTYEALMAKPTSLGYKGTAAGTGNYGGTMIASKDLRGPHSSRQFKDEAERGAYEAGLKRNIQDYRSSKSLRNNAIGGTLIGAGVGTAADLAVAKGLGVYTPQLGLTGALLGGVVGAGRGLMKKDKNFYKNLDSTDREKLLKTREDYANAVSKDIRHADEITKIYN